jgi:hypothetical protein
VGGARHAEELADALFRPLDPDAPARARASAPAWSWRRGLRRRAPSESLARATAALGVRAVIAASFAGGHDRLLALHGVLPLSWLEPGDRREVRAGDELEIPRRGGASGVGTRVAIRHLTRGFTFERPLRPGAAVARAGARGWTPARPARSAHGGSRMSTMRNHLISRGMRTQVTSC